MRRTLTILVILYFVGAGFVKGQQLPVYSQFFFNPYLYNPSYAGTDHRLTVMFTHRQQWIGIEGAPVTSNVSIHSPLGGAVSLGASITQDETGIFKNTTGLLSFAYTLSMSHEQTLRFGLSGGLGSNTIDFNSIGSPPLGTLSALETSNYFAANFGLSYHYNHLTIGAALPQLISNDLSNPIETQDINFTPFDNILVNLHYLIVFENDDYSFEPYLVYHYEKNNAQFIELMGLFHIQHKVWLGGSYRLGYGPSAFLGFHLGDQLYLGYAHELGTTVVDQIGQGTHEVQLKLHFGKTYGGRKTHHSKRQREYMAKLAAIRAARRAQRDSLQAQTQRDRVAADVDQRIINQSGDVEHKARLNINSENEVDNRPPDYNPDGPVDTEIASKDDDSELEGGEDRPIQEYLITIDHNDETVVVQRGDHMFELQGGYFVVVAAFDEFRHAESYDDVLYEHGISDVKFGYVTQKEHWYVYVHHHDTLEEARRDLGVLKANPNIADPWILHVQE